MLTDVRKGGRSGILIWRISLICLQLSSNCRKSSESHFRNPSQAIIHSVQASKVIFQSHLSFLLHGYRHKTTIRMPLYIQLRCSPAHTLKFPSLFSKAILLKVIVSCRQRLMFSTERLIYRSLLAQPRRGEPWDWSKTTKAALRAMSPKMAIPWPASDWIPPKQLSPDSSAGA